MTIYAAASGEWLIGVASNVARLGRVATSGDDSTPNDHIRASGITWTIAALPTRTNDLADLGGHRLGLGAEWGGGIRIRRCARRCSPLGLGTVRRRGVVSRRRPPVPVEPPGWWRCFTPEDWAAPGDDTRRYAAGEQMDQVEVARRRWWDAKRRWAAENGLDVVTWLRQQSEARLWQVRPEGPGRRRRR